MEAISQSVTFTAEPLTPFMPWSVEERAPLPEPATASEPERQLLAGVAALSVLAIWRLNER